MSLTLLLASRLGLFNEPGDDFAGAIRSCAKPVEFACQFS